MFKSNVASQNLPGVNNDWASFMSGAPDRNSYGLPPSRDVTKPPGWEASVDKMRPSSAVEGLNSAAQTAMDTGSFDSLGKGTATQRFVNNMLYGGGGAKGGISPSDPMSMQDQEILMSSLQARPGQQVQGVKTYAGGGLARDALSQAMAMIMAQLKQPVKAAAGMYVGGDAGDGVSDDVEARLSVGEYVIPADVVSGLGKGSSEAGAKVLDNLVQSVRSMHTQHMAEMPPPR